MAEAEKARVKLAKQDRKEANELLVAVENEDEARVRRLLGIGHNPDAAESSTLPSGVEGMKDGYSALYGALSRENLVIARLLLVAGATVDLTMGESRWTVLMVAAGINHLEVARLFFKFGANPNAVNRDGAAALHFAAARGHAAMTSLLVDHGAALNVQDDTGRTALHDAALKGTIEAARVLLDADAAIDLEDKEGHTPAKMSLLSKHFAILELLLRHGASAHRAAVLPDDVPGVAWTEDEAKFYVVIAAAFQEQPSFVHLLADHGGICQKRVLGCMASHLGHTQVSRALRQVGCDVWCAGGEGLNELRKTHSIDGTKLLGDELVGHTLQVRLRPAQLTACNDPLGLDRGARVTVYGLTSAAGLLLNAKCGKLGGPLGSMKPGRYPVFFKGDKGYKQLKACNLRSLVDPGRAAVAGHEVDALHSVVMRGVTGPNAGLNAAYVLNPAHTANRFPVFTHASDNRLHLFCGDTGRWYVSDTANMVAGNNCGTIASSMSSPSPLQLKWKVSDGTYGWTLDPAITLATPTWITGSPPAPWTRRDVTVTAYNEASHEHTVVFCDGPQTSLHLRLGHLHFLDWDVLPRRRAAMLAPRAAMTFFMIMNRMRARQIPTEAPLTVRMGNWPTGTPVLRIMMRVWMRTDKEFEFFRDIMWPHVVAPPNLIVRGQREDARAARAAEAADAAAAATMAAATSGGGRSGGSGKKKRGGKKKEKRKGRKRR